ncbi:hypothetical protein [Acidithiobacillus ferriphilus]|nr:hypothetical protein [Acidithiobacillus ferriphilus]
MLKRKGNLLFLAAGLLGLSLSVFLIVQGAMIESGVRAGYI